MSEEAEIKEKLDFVDEQLRLQEKALKEDEEMPDEPENPEITKESEKKIPEKRKISEEKTQEDDEVPEKQLKSDEEPPATTTIEPIDNEVKGLESVSSEQKEEHMEIEKPDGLTSKEISKDDLKQSEEETTITKCEAEPQSIDKIVSDEVQIASDEVKIASDEVKIAVDEVKNASDEVKIASDEVKNASDEVNIAVPVQENVTETERENIESAPPSDLKISESEEPIKSEEEIKEQRLKIFELNESEQALDQEYRDSLEPFLQHVPCFKLKTSKESDYDDERVPRCRECRRKDIEVDAAAGGSDVYCRFYEFRRLQYTLEGFLNVAGFPDPHLDPKQDDINIWEPDDKTEPTAGYMDVQVCRYILLHVGDQFCYLWQQEVEALKMHENPDGKIAWKKLVRDIREICDVCDTTLFNYHWTCNKCGFGVCLDCFKDRKNNKVRHKFSSKSRRGRDDHYWLLCTGTNKHELKELMLTQIITGDSLQALGQLLHEARIIWQIPQKCDCLLSHKVLPEGQMKHKLQEVVNDMINESRLNQQTAASSLATKETLRHQRRMEKFHRIKLNFARSLGIDYVPGRIVTKETLDKDPITTAFDSYEHINFLRKGMAGYRRFLPPKVMTMCASTMIAPNVRHEWLCDGKLLRLTDPLHPDNRILFQEVWKCGQPVMVSEVARSLNLDLWRPEAFCRDFGDKPNDLINCLNGNLVPNQPMRHFWEGFQCIKKRLLDASGNPMLLKLKDWPPGDDFAEILPTRYADLMKGLPLPEYTLRTGNLNIASCLPKMFVPPDLGPKMYNAYGSALHPDKGTTNLHLDISDAVNIMVYVGIPQDAESKPQLDAAQHAIAMGGCDFLTRLRCRSSKVLPGALWHIFAARDADKIRDLLNRVTLEKGFRLEPDHDPIHDQNWYLDDELRARLFREYRVKGYPIVQCLGDAVFIPAGAPHQVQNLHNCIKVAEDFVSPENITHCYHLTHEFRQLSNSHTNHEDKLQIKNIIYHAIKDCCTILMTALDKRFDFELSELKRTRKMKREQAKATAAAQKESI